MKRTNHDRRYTGSSVHRPDNLKFRQDEAKERQETWDKLSAKEKLSVLDTRLGKDVGAKKQRAKLLEKINGKHATGALIPEDKK